MFISHSKEWEKAKQRKATGFVLKEGKVSSAAKQCSEGKLNLKRANKIQVVFTLTLFIFFTDLLVVKLLRQCCLNSNVSPQKLRKFV